MALPLWLGIEGSGRVSEVGAGVQGLSPGQRVAWKWAPGSYAQRVLVDCVQAIRVPDDISDDVAAAILIGGLTALCLTSAAYNVQPGDVAVVHAAAGATGHILTQVLKSRGAKVVAIVSSAAKAGCAHAAGADRVVVLDDSGFEEAVRDLSAGAGADVAYDSVGAPTFKADLDVIRTGGTVLLFGQTGGAVPHLDPSSLPRRIRLLRPSMPDFLDTREKLLTAAGELFGMVRRGIIRVEIAGVYPLRQAALAHAKLENRRVAGKQLLDPSIDG